MANKISSIFHQRISPRLLITTGAFVCLLSSVFSEHSLASANHSDINSPVVENIGYCTDSNIIQKWKLLIERHKNSNIMTQLKETNNFFNREIHYSSDRDNYQESDLWATPVETMMKGEGDCEDFSIAKFRTLRLMGVDESKLRLTYVRAHYGRSSISEAHMVLSYYHNQTSDPLILDNLSLAIHLGSERTDLEPVFSFNTENLWKENQLTEINPIDRMGQWRMMGERLSNQEGLCI